MKSKWYELKNKAIYLRKSGLSIKKIEHNLAIPRSTLSGWFKNIKLTKEQRDVLYNNWKKALVEARKIAVIWHNEQKNNRLQDAQQKAMEILDRIDIKNKDMVDLALSLLYLGEGFKKTTETGIGNSDPLILKFFVCVLKMNYGLKNSQMKCELHLRADQKKEELKLFWSNALNLPVENFTSVQFDKRTIGSPTYSDYKGVCVVRCGNVAIQRKLVYLSRLFCEKVSTMGD